MIRGRQDGDAVRQDFLDHFHPHGHAVTPPATCLAVNIRRLPQGCTPACQDFLPASPGVGLAAGAPGGPVPGFCWPASAGFPATAPEGPVFDSPAREGAALRAGWPASAGGAGEEWAWPHLHWPPSLR